MYFTNDSMLPENQQPLIITVAPYGPQWLPSDYPEGIPVTWEEQTQKAVDCYNAGATVLHLQVRDPKTGHGSKNLHEFNDQIGRLRKAGASMEEIMEVLKLCVVQGVQPCNLGVPILDEELQRSSSTKPVPKG